MWGVQEGVDPITNLPCLGGVLSTDRAAELYEVLAKDAFLRRMRNRRSASFELCKRCDQATAPPLQIPSPCETL